MPSINKQDGDMDAHAHQAARNFPAVASATTLTKRKSMVKSIRLSSRKPTSPSKFRAHMGQLISATQPTMPSAECRQRLSFTSSQSTVDAPLNQNLLINCSSSQPDLTRLPHESDNLTNLSGLHATAAELLRQRQRDRILKHSVSMSADKLPNARAFQAGSSFASPVKQVCHSRANYPVASPRRHIEKADVSQLDYFQTPSKTPRHAKPANVTATAPAREFAVPAQPSAVKSGGRLELLAGPFPSELHALRTPYRRLARNLFNSSASQQNDSPHSAYERKAAVSRSAEEYNKRSKLAANSEIRKNNGGPIAFSDYFEWSLVTKIRLTVSRTLTASVRHEVTRPATSEQRSHGSMAASRNCAVLDADNFTSVDQFQTKLAQALTFWAFPLSHSSPNALPHWSFEVKSTDSVDSGSRLARNSVNSAAPAAVNKQNLLTLWQASLNDLWVQTKQNFCPYFYIVSHYWTALVVSPSLTHDQPSESGNKSAADAAAGRSKRRRGSSLLLSDVSFSSDVDVPAASPMIMLAKPPKGCINTLRDLDIKLKLWRYRTEGAAAAAVVSGEAPLKISESAAVDSTTANENGNSMPPPKNAIVIDAESYSQSNNRQANDNDAEKAKSTRKRRRVNLKSVTAQKPTTSRRSSGGNKRRRAATPLSTAPEAAGSSSPERNISGDVVDGNRNWRTPSPSAKHSANMLRTPDSPFPVGDILKGLKDAGRLKLVDEMSGSYHYRQAAIDTLQLLTIAGGDECDKFVSEFLIKQVESLVAPATTVHAYIPPLLLAPTPFMYGAQMQLESSWSKSAAESKLTCLEIGGGPVMPHVAPYLAWLWQRLLKASSTEMENEAGENLSSGDTIAFIKHNASAVLSSFFTAASPAVSLISPTQVVSDVLTLPQAGTKIAVLKAANPLEMETVIDLPLKLDGVEENENAVKFTRNGLDEVLFNCMRRFSQRNEAFTLEADPDA